MVVAINSDRVIVNRDFAGEWGACDYYAERVESYNKSNLLRKRVLRLGRNAQRASHTSA